MAAFHNNPELKGENGEGKVKKYVHQPLENDHFDIHYKIQPNGRIVLCAADGSKVEIPASLVFKLAQLLRATRQVKFVSVAEAKDFSETD